MHVEKIEAKNDLTSFGFVFLYFVIARNADLSGRVILSIILYSIPLLLFVIPALINTVQPLLYLNRSMWLLTIVPFIYSSPIWLDLVLFTIGIMIIITQHCSIQDIGVFFSIVKIVAIINAACVLIQLLVPTFFVPIVEKWFPEAMYEYYLMTLSLPYIGGCNAIPGDTAGYLINAIGILICYILTSGRKQIKKSAFILLVFLCSALVFTGKRSFILLLVSTTLIVFVLLRKGSKKISGVFKALIYVLFLFFIVNYLRDLLPKAYSIQRVIDSINNLVLGADVSNGRLRLYRYALQEFDSAPMLGIGWKQFNALTINKYNYSNVHYVNCDYLQILCETGIVGLVFMFTPMFIFLFKSIKENRCIQNDINIDLKYKIAFVYSIFMQVFFLSYCILEIPLYNRSTLFMYFISVSIGYCMMETSKKTVIKTSQNSVENLMR